MSNEGDTARTDYETARAGDVASAQDKRDAAAYRELMADVDSSRFETNARTLDTLRPGLDRKLAENGNDYTPGDLDTGTWESLRQAQNLISDAFSTAAGAGVQITTYLRDPRVFPGEKREKADEMVSDAHGKMDTNVTVARAALDSVEADLYAATRPVVGEGKGMEAREDARMLLDGAEDGAEIQRRITGYVTEADDDVAALLCDPAWIGRYMTGRGLDPKMIDVYGTSVAHKVAERAMSSEDKRRKASAHALAHVRNVRAALDVVGHARRNIDPRSSR